MNYFTVAALAEVSRVITKGTTPPSTSAAPSDSGIRFIKVESIGESGRINPSKCSHIDAETHQSLRRSILEQGDILFSIAGTIGRTALVTKEVLPANTNQAVAIIRPNERLVDGRYLYYCLSNPQVAVNANSKVVQSVQKNLSLGELGNIGIPIPALNEQREISSILGALDDKLDSLKSAVRVAQDLAQTYFKSWFVSYKGMEQQVPSGWEKAKLADICDLRRDSVKAGEFTDLPYVPVDSLESRSLAINSWKPNSQAQSSLVRFEPDDILIGAMRVYFHRVAIAPFAGLTRTTAFTIRPKHPKYLMYTLLLCNENTTIEYAQTTSKGSTMPYAVWEGGLADLEIAIPPDQLLSEFTDLVTPLIDFVKSSGQQLRLLENLRDTLLPQLLSGSIRVGEAD